MDAKKQPRIIEDLKAELAAVMAKYEPRIKDSELGGCGVQLLWRIYPSPTTYIESFGEVPHG
jgi:hypothetical protein